MKHLKHILIFFVILSFFNCQNEDITTPLSNSEKRSIALEDFKNLFIENYDNFINIKKKQELLNKQSKLDFNKKMLIKKESEEILSPLINQARKLINSYGVNDNEIIEIYGDINDSRQVLFGLAILAEKQSLGNKNKSKLSYKAKNPYLECLKEVLGLNIGIGILHDLGDEAIEKAVKTFLKKNCIQTHRPRWNGNNSCRICLVPK